MLEDAGTDCYNDVLVSFNCQHDTAQSRLRKEFLQLRDCPHQIVLWACLRMVSWLLIDVAVGNTIPWTGGPGLYKKPS